MPRVLNIEKFRGDNKQPFQKQIQIFTANLEVLHVDKEKFKQTLLCWCESKEFTLVSQYMAPCNNVAFTDERGYDGRFLWRRLQTNVRNKSGKNKVHKRTRYTVF